jgi:hypothetical protein
VGLRLQVGHHGSFFTTCGTMDRPSTEAGKLPILGASALPESLDWSTTNNPLGRSIVTPPQNQGNCGEPWMVKDRRRRVCLCPIMCGTTGACWAFVAAKAVESAVAQRTGMLTPLSVQQLVDCDHNLNAGQ